MSGVDATVLTLFLPPYLQHNRLLPYLDIEAYITKDEFAEYPIRRLKGECDEDTGGSAA